MERTGFKEWSLICEALGRGEQSLIIRKGGIAEGREGFSFKHPEFFLYPTWFHEQPQKVRGQHQLEAPLSDETVEIEVYVQLDTVRIISSLPVAEALASMHIWQPEVIRERFDYDEAPGVHVAFVRAFRLLEPWKFPNEKRFGGCRSWVELPQPPHLKLEAVLTEDEHERRREDFLNIVDRAVAL